MKISIKKHLLTLLAVPAFALSVAGVVTVPTYVSAVADSGCNTSGGLSAAAECAKSEDQPADLFADGGVFQDITDVLLFIIGAVSVVMLIIGGIRYTISQGDSSAVTSAKNTILYAVIGLVVAILAYAVIHYVIGALAAPAE